VQAASSAADLRRWAVEADEAEVLPALTEMVKQEIADILRMEAGKLDTAVPLQDLGLDSLMGVELMTAVEARFGIRIPVMALAEVGTIDKLARRIARELRRGKDAAPADAGGEIDEQVRSLAAQHAGEIAPGTVEAIAAEIRLTER
jgi:acyl carrier protein